MIETTDQLKDKLDEITPDENASHTIQFDYPNNDRAVMCVKRNSEIILWINCWKWAQTRHVRMAFAYGSNHDSRSLKWSTVRRVLLDNIEDQELYGLERPQLAYSRDFEVDLKGRRIA